MRLGAGAGGVAVRGGGGGVLVAGGGGGGGWRTGGGCRACRGWSAVIDTGRGGQERDRDCPRTMRESGVRRRSRPSCCWTTRALLPVAPRAFVALLGVSSLRAGLGAGRASLRCWTPEGPDAAARILAPLTIDRGRAALAARAQTRPAASTSRLALARTLGEM